MKPLLLALTLSACFTAGAADLTNKVLIIGIDGTMPSALAVAHTPNLDALKSNGCYSVRVVTHPVTHSAACWSSFFTGVWGDKHGVNDPGNSFAGNQFSNYPSFFKHLEAANSNWNTLAFARWAPVLTVVPDADVKLAFGTDAAITDETCRRLTNSNPDVLWMILLDVDSAGHASGWGPTVTNYVRAVEIADGRVGQIIGALTKRATYTNENWLVMVQADHGQHDDPDPERSRVVFTILSGPSVARGVIWPSPAIVDACRAVFAHMGVPIDPAWNLDARPVGFPASPTRYGTNLIVNGDAEANSGTNGYTPDRGIAWWFDVASTTLGLYGTDSNFPGPASPGPADRGANFFLGGTTNGSILQRIDISDLAAEVDGLGSDFTLAGWFGGKADEEDWALLSAKFLDISGTVIGSNAVGHVTAAERGGVTGLLSRSADGTLPGGTRFVEFALTNHVVTGRNDGSTDNLSFVLTARVPPVIMANGRTTDGWQVEFTTSPGRLYSLERSEDLKAWVEVAPPTTGSGGTSVLVDANPPAVEAFYRIASRHP